MAEKAEKLDARLVKLGAIIVCGAFLSAMDATIVSVSLDSVGQEFSVSLSSLQWVAAGYLLALAMVVPVTGWAAERFGARRMWLFALSLFTGASVLCGAAWSVESLIAFRLLQGLGGGLIPPLAQILLVRAAGPRRIGRVMTMVSVPTQLAPIVGPSVGGLLVHDLGWRWIYYINLPLGAVALLFAWLALEKDTPAPGTSGRLDVLGLLLLSPGLTVLLYGLSVVEESPDGFGSPRVLAFVGGGALLLAVFVGRALRPRQVPSVVDLRLFRNREFALASGLLFLLGATLFGAMFLLPLYYQQVLGHDALRAGLMLAPQGAGTVIALALAGALVDRLGPRYIVLAGIALTVVGTLAFTGSGTGTDDALLTGSLVLRGLGLGAVATPLTATAYRSLAKDAVPRAASGLVIVQRIGGSLGTAALAVLLQAQLGRDGGAEEASPAVLADAFAATFWWTAGLSAVALVPALFLPGRPRESEDSGAPETDDGSSPASADFERRP
ncbi:MDR family MFS transporter [Streptomyces sp. TRM68416]|uniref:MDR family MFS transporter n=1 Tax=Streptomyces sp. TRM68416 TaxID=2758412 RepID=UPI001661E4E8|nr:MDR family MFS transporter [Streptomyces sp. TRM68416]MBD0838367.1 DHA2 family efflux MFS transporter permease subunit [Streptomyces sp. TRM68416]